VLDKGFSSLELLILDKWTPYEGSVLDVLSSDHVLQENPEGISFTMELGRKRKGEKRMKEL
jgi:hypothetical protein